MSILAELVLFGLSFLAAATVLQLVILTGVAPDPAEASWVGPVAGPSVMGLCGLAYLALERRGERALAGPLRVSRPATGRAWATTALDLVLALGGSVALALLMTLLGAPPQEQLAVREIIDRGIGLDLVLLGVAALILAPVFEEWVFRGMLFRRLVHGGHVAWAYPLSALAFALIHFNPSGVPTYLWLGLVFAHAYHRTGRLWCASLVHLGNNAATLTLLLLDLV